MTKKLILPNDEGMLLYESIPDEQINIVVSEHNYNNGEVEYLKVNAKWRDIEISVTWDDDKSWNEISEYSKNILHNVIAESYLHFCNQCKPKVIYHG